MLVIKGLPDICVNNVPIGGDDFLIRSCETRMARLLHEACENILLPDGKGKRTFLCKNPKDIINIKTAEAWRKGKLGELVSSTVSTDNAINIQIRFCLSMLYNLKFSER